NISVWASDSSNSACISLVSKYSEIFSYSFTNSSSICSSPSVSSSMSSGVISKSSDSSPSEGGKACPPSNTPILPCNEPTNCLHFSASTVEKENRRTKKHRSSVTISLYVVSQLEGTPLSSLCRFLLLTLLLLLQMSILLL